MDTIHLVTHLLDYRECSFARCCTSSCCSRCTWLVHWHFMARSCRDNLPRYIISSPNNSHELVQAVNHDWMLSEPDTCKHAIDQPLVLVAGQVTQSPLLYWINNPRYKRLGLDQHVQRR